MEKLELDWLKKWAQYSPKKIALRCEDSNRSFTYLDLYERSSQLASVLQSKYSISPGDRVCLLAHNEPENIFLYFALQRLGAILVPINFRFSPREVAHVIRDAEPKLTIAQESLLPGLSELGKIPVWMFEGANGFAARLSGPTEKKSLPVVGAWEDPVMILYTSGTTGSPKGALITNKMIFWNSVNTGMRLSITAEDSTLIFHPMFHTSGWHVLTTPFFHHGATIHLVKKFDAEKILLLAAERKISVLFGVPTMMDRMAAAAQFKDLDLSSIRYAVVGGEPMPIELIRVWGEKGVPVRQGFGLTEFGPNVFSLNEADAIRKKGSIGFPNFYIDAKLVNEAGEEILEPNVPGELCLRGPACTPGYWRNPKATTDSIKDGWFYTGDLLKRDEEGYFFVVGRKKDMFISGGENVYPVEIEQFLRLQPEVHEVAVIGIADAQWGEVGKCFYSTKSGHPLDERILKEYCQTGLAKYKVPKVFQFLTDLPKGDSGKILKKSLS